jgi:hypothetical protein
MTAEKDLREGPKVELDGLDNKPVGMKDMSVDMVTFDAVAGW